jgi:glycosyltransferase involved in cell wall biosynthesis
MTTDSSISARSSGRPIHVGLWFDYGLKYSGGLNYFRNLLHAVHAAQAPDVRTTLFIGRDLPPELAQQFSRITRVVTLDLLTRGTRAWFVHRSLYRSLRWQVCVERELRRHEVDIVSHPSMVERLTNRFKLISWIQDFQYLHLPELFPHVDPTRRTRELKGIHRHSHALVVSSRAAYKDFQCVMGQDLPARTHVLPFVSQLHVEPHDAARAEALLKKHGVPERYILLPNQFWAHKNHLRAFEAVARLKREGVAVSLVCTGWMRDPNHSPASTAEALRVIETEHLEDQVHLLGSIDYADVLGLMRGCVAVLNPSLFEGWSSSVEESKSLGKPALLSDLPVHREQAHPDARYFDPRSVEHIAAVLREAWETLPHGAAPDREAAAKQSLAQRTCEFGQRYLDIVREVAGRPSHEITG